MTEAIVKHQTGSNSKGHKAIGCAVFRIKIGVNALKLLGHEVVVKIETETHYSGASNYWVEKKHCTVIEDNTIQPEPKINIEVNPVSDNNWVKDRLEEVKENEPIPFDLELWKSGKYDVVNGLERKVNIIAVEIGLDMPVIAISENGKALDTYTEDGSFYKGQRGQGIGYDLFLIPKTTKVWVNLFESDAFVYKSDAETEGKYATPSGLKYIETVEINKPIQ